MARHRASARQSPSRSSTRWRPADDPRIVAFADDGSLGDDGVRRMTTGPSPRRMAGTSSCVEGRPSCSSTWLSTRWSSAARVSSLQVEDGAAFRRLRAAAEAAEHAQPVDGFSGPLRHRSRRRRRSSIGSSSR